ncbi:hypothetical protein NKG05_01955 [Oerskovia sp. M15]
MLRRFGSWHSPIRDLIEGTAEADVLRHDLYDLARPLQTYGQGRTVLLGDAAHAMTPDLGQGAARRSRTRRPSRCSCASSRPRSTWTTSSVSTTACAARGVRRSLVGPVRPPGRTALRAAARRRTGRPAAARPVACRRRRSTAGPAVDPTPGCPLE